MASKLLAHEALILQSVAAGLSYEAVARRLAELDCKTTASGVFNWLKRRANRIESRARLIDPLARYGRFDRQGGGAEPQEWATSRLDPESINQLAAAISTSIAETYGHAQAGNVPTKPATRPAPEPTTVAPAQVAYRTFEPATPTPSAPHSAPLKAADVGPEVQEQTRRSGSGITGARSIQACAAATLQEITEIASKTSFLKK